MLDQNTDRMWYVIGAVIIGAAIILIMNKTFPQLFASVGDTFKSKTEQTTEVVDGILPQGRNVFAHVSWVDDYYISFGGSVISRVGQERDDSYTPEYIPTANATRLTLELQKSIGEAPGQGRILAYDANKKFIGTIVDGNASGVNYVPELRTSTPYIVHAAIPEHTAYIRASLIKGSSGFYSLVLTNTK